MTLLSLLLTPTIQEIPVKKGKVGIQVFAGKDGKIRSADVKTAAGFQEDQLPDYVFVML